MAFPGSPLAVTTELQIGGVWTDVTGDVYLRDRISITRGRADEGSRVDPGKCQLTLNNRGGKYSPRNPMSPYYGALGRNTPIRVSVAGDPYLRVDAVGDRATTPEVAALDVTGDLDLRLDVTLDDWYRSDATDLVAKWTDADNGWRLILYNSGHLFFGWSTDGTTSKGYASTVPVTVPPSGRIALRVTLDVDNGSGSHVLTYYTAPTIAGPWTQLGVPSTGTGFNGVRANAQPLEVGDRSDSTYPPAAGKWHALELRNGIDGTVVASPDFTAQPVGTTSFTDSAGRAWTLAGAAAITDRHVRFLGEVSAWPARWDVSGNDVWVPIQASGLLRRLGQGAKPLNSTLRRRIPSFSPVAYWPLEEDRDATQAYSPIQGVQAALVSGLQFAADDTLGGSSALPTLGDTASFSAQVPATNAASWQIELVYRIDQAPAAGADAEMLRFATGGGSYTWRVGVDANAVHLTVTTTSGTQAVSSVLVPTDFFGRWNRLHIDAKQNGTMVDWSLNWITIGQGSLGMADSFAGTCRSITSIGTTFGPALQGMALGHLSVLDHVDTTVYNYADHGFNGELAWDRVLRLASEEGIPLSLVGYGPDTTAMGPQRPDTLLDLLQDCAETDGGVLGEQRDRISLRWRSRASIYAQPVTLALDYQAPGLAPPLEPVEDDQGTRNDITVKRVGGSSARVVLEDGPLSVQAPPAGVGLYNESVDLNLHEDAQAEPIAWWRLHLGTWDAPRYPRLRVDLAAAPNLIDSAIAVDTGDRVTIANPPPWLPPETIDLLVEGYTETLGVYDWELQFNCSPAGPWNVASADSGARADTDGSQLAAAIDSAQTSIPVEVTAGPLWADNPADLPYDVTVGGEQMTVTAVRPRTDTFGRTANSGWGTSDTGQAWTTTGGTASDYSVNGSVGIHSATSRNVFRHTMLPAPAADVDLQADFATDAVAAGDSLYVFLMARYTGTSSFYFARVQMTTTQTMTMSLRKRTAAGGEVLLTSANLSTTHTAGAFYTVRLRIDGSSLSAKCWQTGIPEPPDWVVTATDTDITVAGSVGVRSLVPTNNTTALPVQFSFDNFTILGPQVLAVTRSANRITKSHPAGDAVTLPHPARVAL